MTWVTFYLALHPDSQESIREEVTSITGHKDGKRSTGIDYWDLKNAAVVDSFIREVLRMKNDSVNLVRSTIKDVEMGGYIIPKGRRSTRTSTELWSCSSLFRLHGLPDDLPVLPIHRIPLQPGRI